MNQNENEKLPPIEIPWAELSAESLKNVIGEYIEREGTDYGSTEISYETKFKQLYIQIQKSIVKVVFDPNNESVTLITSRDLAKLLIYKAIRE